MRFTGVGLVILAAICWGITGGIADILMSKGWDPIVISLYRGAVGLLCFFVWFLVRFRHCWVNSSRLYFWSILAGLGVAGNFTFYFLSIQAASVAVAATLMYTAPVIVLLISFLFGIERSTWFKWCCIAGVLLGIILLTGAYNTESISVSFLGVATGIGAGISYAVFIFGFKKASAKGKPQPSLIIAFLTFFVILFTLSDKSQAADVLSSNDLGWFILIGIIGSGLSFILYMNGIRSTTPTTASMVAMVEPVTASLFGLMILGDQLNIIQLLGMVLILVTVTTLSMKQSG
ncbi:EamA/RhaT family transporter [Filobacillus milosensis]|uniref:EamA/RhaT family transporter n=1 Tax=Filobacillus milosensis TaxID=94137 RepID=A0A4Y8IHI9_9BACI|nr:DMT family transporter [Filobacillus milosensis]TFB18533.1 EamA/RhaT family transporter [Filobacillus milosensis]